jgi:hypothetical protein
VENPDAYAWVFDVVSSDPACRRAALDRYRVTLEAAHEAQHWINRVWALAGSPAPEQPHLAAEMDQARAAKRDADAQTFFAPLSHWWCGWNIDPLGHEEFAPHAVCSWNGRHVSQMSGGRLEAGAIHLGV